MSQQTTAGDEARANRQAGQAQKMAAVKAVLSDPALGDAAKVVFVTAAIHFGYSKGVIRAERKTIGRRCNKTARGVERAIVELESHHYWTVDRTPGRANVYTLISPEERVQIWVRKKRQHHQECQDWLGAENHWKYSVEHWLNSESIYHWLTAEKTAKDEYTLPIFSAIYQRGGDYEKAVRFAEGAWRAQQRAGDLPVGSVLDRLADTPDGEFAAHFGTDPAPEPSTSQGAGGTPEGAGYYTLAVGVGTPQGAGYYTPGVGGGTLANSPSCGNDHATSTSRTDKDAEVHSPPATRAPSARSAGAQSQEHELVATCSMCDDRGLLLDGEVGNETDLVILSGKHYPDDIAHVQCQHSMPRNFIEINRTTEDSDDPIFGPNKTGWFTLDKIYGFIDDGDTYDDAGRLVPTDDYNDDEFIALAGVHSDGSADVYRDTEDHRQ